MQTIIVNDIITDLQHTPDSEHTGQSNYDLQNESLLAAEITSLWSEHVRGIPASGQQAKNYVLFAQLWPKDCIA